MLCCNHEPLASHEVQSALAYALIMLISQVCTRLKQAKQGKSECDGIHDTTALDTKGLKNKAAI
jgi:hypothetical protein